MYIRLWLIYTDVRQTNKTSEKKIFLIENFKNIPRVSYSMKLIFLTLIFLKEEGILQLTHFKFSFFLIPKK